MARRAKLHTLIPTGQRAPLAGAAHRQVQNSAGGFVFGASDWLRLDRFLVLGSEAGSYYASPRKLTTECAAAVRRLIAKAGPSVVAQLVAVSTAGRAPRQDPALFALALCLKQGDAPTRAAAVAAVPEVCRTATHLFTLADHVQALGGWGRGTRRAFSAWYTDRGEQALAYQLVKYQRREGWSHRDLLRLCHAKAPTEGHQALYRWACKGFEGSVPDAIPVDSLRLPWAMAQAQANAASPATVAAFVRAHQLPRECVPSAVLKHPAVWEALLFAGAGMPLTAMLRNLASMTANGVFARSPKALERVISTVTDPAALRAARVHPLAVLVALETYRRGAGLKGSLSWTPEKRLVAALDRAFYLAFAAIEGSGRRHLLAIDVSGSMDCGTVAGMTGISPRVGAAAMAMATLRAEPSVEVVAFSDKLIPVDLAEEKTLQGVVERMRRIPMGGTDCAAPMLYAMEKGLKIDVFVVYTDSETWAGKVHPVEALRRYRRATGIQAKLIVVGMLANRFSIADPTDAGMLDVVGFDTAAPQIMADFARRSAA